MIYDMYDKNLNEESINKNLDDVDIEIILSTKFDSCIEDINTNYYQIDNISNIIEDNIIFYINNDELIKYKELKYLPLPNQPNQLEYNKKYLKYKKKYLKYKKIKY